MSKNEKQDAITEVGNSVYKAALIFGKLEGTGNIRGNGHHIAQEISKYAMNIMKVRFIKTKENI